MFHALQYIVTVPHSILVVLAYGAANATKGMSCSLKQSL